MIYGGKKYTLCNLSICITNELTGNRIGGFDVLLWLSIPFKSFKTCWACTRCQMSIFNYYFHYCDLWLKQILVLFVCEYILCNLPNTMIFINGERFHPIIINMISQLVQMDIWHLRWWCVTVGVTESRSSQLQ